MAEFVTPSFLANHSPDEIYEKMKSILPADIDLSEGGHGWNMTRPTALVAAEICEFILPEVIKLIFPEWSYDEFLDEHAKSTGMTRRAATAASGILTITGIVGTVIPAGSIFSTASINSKPSVDYKVLKTATIPDAGAVDVDIQCTQAGIIGNTPPGTIIMLSSRLTGIKSATNAEAVTGGTEEESDESLIQRIMECEQSQSDSFTGCVADYKRWALSVPGVGSATVIPAQDDTGLVTIIITDANGAPATTKLCTDVHNYIMMPENPEERRAPINALLQVKPPVGSPIGIKATVELAEGATLEAVTTAYAARLSAYLPTALDDKEIKYTRLAAALSATDGVNDFSDLEFCVMGDGDPTYGTANVTINAYQLPTIDASNLILTSGVV